MPQAQSALNESVSIIVPVHNRIALARPVFEALQRETEDAPDVVVTVVDQGSTDGVDALAQDLGFQVVHSTASTAGALRNVGVDASRGRWLCFIDSDVLVPVGYVRRLRARLAQHPTAVVGCLYTLPESSVWSEYTWDALTVSHIDGPREWLNAGNLALARNVFEQLGGFDPRLTSAEDTDFCARSIRAGIPVLQFSDLGAAHLGNPKTLLQFFNKQIWHGQHAPWVNQNSLAALAHVTSALTALIYVALVPELHWALLAGNIVPLTAYARIALRKKKLVNVLPSLLLLHTYLFARFVALVYKSPRQR